MLAYHEEDNKPAQIKDIVSLIWNSMWFDNLYFGTYTEAGLTDEEI